MLALEHVGSLLGEKISPGPATAPPSRTRNAVTEIGAVAGGIGTATAVTFVGVLGAYALIPVGVLVGGATVGAIAKRFRRRRRVVAVPLLEARPGDGAVTYRGIARSLGKTIMPLSGDAPVLAEQIAITTDAGVLFRRVELAPFLVEREDGAPYVVAGVVRLATEPSRSPMLRDDARFATIGIPGRFACTATLESQVVRDGDPITLTGVPVPEVLPDLAFHREAGAAAVMRGRAEAVTIVRN